MKKWNNLVQNWLRPACVIYTIFIVVFLLFAQLLSSEHIISSLNMRNALCFLGFSLCWAAANLVFRMQIGSLTKYVFHAGALLCDFILFILVFTGYAINRGFGAVIACLFFLVFYIIIMGLGGMISYARKEEKNNQKEYTNTFSKQ